MRIIHRDLGFLMVGVSIIYATSGIIVNHMGSTDPAYKTVTEELIVESNLMQSEIEQLFAEREMVVRRIAKVDEEHSRVMLEGGVGMYNSVTGELVYEQHTRREIIYWFNRLHYNKVRGWSFMGDFFAISLIFFAISGVIMVRGKKGINGRGKWYLLVGIAIPIIYVLLSK